MRLSAEGGFLSSEEAEDGDVAVEAGKPELKEPPRFAVVLHNDDYTTMEFVIEILQRFFQKTQDEAMKITMEVHHRGKGVAGIYSREIAETKVVQVNDYSKAHGHPLRSSAEPV